MRFVSALLVLATSLPATAIAQLRPGAPSPDVVPEGWGPSAVVLRGPDGRVRRAYGLDVPAEGADPVARAEAFLARHGHRLAIAPGARIVAGRTIEAHGLTTVRFSRVERGARVIGASLVVSLAGPRVVYVGVDGLDVPLSGAARVVTTEAAERIVLSPAERALRSEPAYLPLGEAAVPVVVVDAAGERLSERRRVIVDARTGAVLAERPLSHDALGRIFMSNPRTDMDVTTDVELPALTSRDRMTGRYFRVLTCNAGARGCEPTQLATADMNGDFLFDPEEPAYDDPFAEVNAYFHANQVATYFRDTHDFTWLCGTDELMRVFVNYTEAPSTPYDNAAYSPSSGSECGFMLFGQGMQDFAYDADVIFHEFGHAVVDQTSELGFFFVDGLGAAYDPMAVNEGTADYFAATVSGDPRMAEYFEMTSGPAGEGALRNLDNDLVCPDDLVGEGHFDGRIWAATGWDLHEAIGPEKTDALFFATIAAVPEVVSFAELAEVTVATAMGLTSTGVLTADDVARVESVLAARGLTDCQRIVPLDDGESRFGYSGQGQITVSAGGGIAPIRYRVDIPADATALILRLQRVSAQGTFEVYGKVGDPPPRFRATTRPPLRSDFALSPDRDSRIVLTRETDPELPRCETLHLAIITTDLSTVGAALYQIQATLEREGTETSCAPDAGPMVDAGVDGGEEMEPRGGGCSCRLAGRAPAHRGLGWLALPVALAWWRRRRR